MSRSTVTIAWLVIVVIGLAAADRFLADVESSEIAASAQRAYAKGSLLLRAGDAEAALDSLREAHALERRNASYSLALVSALTSASKTAEAEPLLNDALLAEPNNGQANLMAARLKLKEGNFSDAVAYYHRAIYGNWGRNAAPQRRAVRMELVHLLIENNHKQELLPELISLEADSPSDPDSQKQLAALFMTAESPGRAAAIYESMVEKEPKDIQANEGLGTAELQLGQYRAAHEAYERAFLQNPNNASIRGHLQVLNTVTGLDPTLRQLTSAEKYRRSVRILEMAREGLDVCVAKGSGSSVDADLIKEADAAVSAKAPVHATNEAAEGVLSLAQRVWRAEEMCQGIKAAEGNPLALIMRKLAS
jgi:tetratricopeptide (TPR) repeat protein